MAIDEIHAGKATLPDPPPSNDDAVEFSDALAELLGHSPPLTDYASSPRLAKAWATAIDYFWRRYWSNGAIDIDQPLYILDLEPGSGRLAAYTLSALEKLVRSGGKPKWPIRYIACAGDAARRGRLLKNTILNRYAENGWFDAASWTRRGGSPIMLGRQQYPLFGTRNPLVVLAGGAWSHRPADLYAVHYGDLLTGRVMSNAAPPAKSKPAGKRKLAYQWRSSSGLADESTSVALLLEHYRGCLNSSALTVPSEAIAALEAISDFSGGRYLLLAADIGVSLEQQVRLNALAPPEEWELGKSLVPVNFHALGWHQDMNGARTANRQWQEPGWVLHVAWKDRLSPATRDEFRHLAELAEAGHPQDCAATLAHGAPIRAGAELLALIRAAGHDPLALEEIAGRIEDLGTLAVDDMSRRALQEALERVWRNAMSDQKSESFIIHLAVLAISVRQWSLARRVLTHGLQQAPSTYGLYLLATVEAETGRTREAIACLVDVLVAEPGNGVGRELMERLEVRLARKHQLPDGQNPAKGNLSLEPLDSMHAGAWLCQYRDHQIGVMTRLPDVETLEQAEILIRERMANPLALELAVVDDDHGFIGVVSLSRVQDMAYFYFWIGIDFQGRGYGRRAGQLAMELARRIGVRHVFTSVYEDNQRSLRALAKLGFVRMPGIKAIAPDETLQFMHAYVGLARDCDGILSDSALRQRFFSLSTAVKSPIVFETQGEDAGTTSAMIERVSEEIRTSGRR